MAFKPLSAFPNLILVLISAPRAREDLIKFNALLSDCDATISAFYSTVALPDWIKEIERVIQNNTLNSMLLLIIF